MCIGFVLMNGYIIVVTFLWMKVTGCEQMYHDVMESLYCSSKK